MADTPTPKVSSWRNIFVPNYALLYRLVVVPLCWRNRVKLDVSEIAGIKPPFVVVSNHPSLYDWAYVARAIWPQPITFLVARYFFYHRMLGPVLKKNGAIPKSMFAADYQAAKSSLQVIRNGGVYGFFPEGRRSVYGELETISQSSFSLIKRMGVMVVNVHIDGGYLATPKYNNRLRHGPIKVKASVLFTADDLAKLNDPAGTQRLLQALDYNDFDYAQHHVFKSKVRAENLESILYICPHCQSEFTMRTQGNLITCSLCQAAAELDAHYRFTDRTLSGSKSWPGDIRQWYLLQKQTEAKRVDAPDFVMQGHVVLKQPIGGSETFTAVGEGQLSISRAGLAFEGHRNDQPYTIHIPIQSLKAIAFDVNESFEAYLGQEYFNFVPDQPQMSVKWSVVYEQLYLLSLSDA